MNNNNNERKRETGKSTEDIFARRKAPGGSVNGAMPIKSGINAPKTAPCRPSEKPKKSFVNKAKILFDRKNGKKAYREHRYFELTRKYAIICFSVIAFAAVVLCTVIGYSYSGDSIRLVSQMTEAERSSARAYRIVYSEADSWGLSAATALHDLFLEKTGASLEVVADSESVSKHEIRVGYTNRAGDDYLTAISALGIDGYAILLTTGDNVNIAAFSEVGVTAAVKYFVDSYVGSYMGGNLTLANRMNVSFVSRSGDEPSASLRESKITLNFTESGKFRILVLSDADINTNTVDAISAIADAEKPDLIIFAGDVSAGFKDSAKSITKADLEAYLKTLTAPIEEKGIPWAVVFGEQENDIGLSAEVQMAVYNSFEHCIAKSDFVSNGIVSYFLPVYAAGEGEVGTSPVFGVWAMGQTGMLSLTDSGAASDPLLSEYRDRGTDYGYVTAAQIAWFSETRKVLDREAGGKMPAIMVCHTPVPEFAVIAENPQKTGMVGNAGEDVASSPLNSGLFTAILEAKNILGLYCGHDHLNSFSGRYCGIELGYCASIGYDGYGFGVNFDINNRLRGGRIIELTLKDGAITSSSRMVYASDYGIGLN